MADRGKAVGQADLATMSVAGEIDVRFELGRLADVVGKVRHHDARNSEGFGRVALQEFRRQVALIDAGQGEQFQLRALYVDSAGFLIKQCEADAVEKRPQMISVVIAKNAEDAKAGFEARDKPADGGSRPAGVALVVNKVSGDQQQIGSFFGRTRSMSPSYTSDQNFRRCRSVICTMCKPSNSGGSAAMGRV